MHGSITKTFRFKGATDLLQIGRLFKAHFNQSTAREIQPPVEPLGRQSKNRCGNHHQRQGEGEFRPTHKVDHFVCF
ncbi:Uncharacterised protein [Vibrio cholerae]|nr:Uncharacterised protein [Vibrio cholerae]